MQKIRDIHTFAVCAYRESPYLEECIRSLRAQTSPSKVILCSSTPSAFLEALAARYQLPLYVRDGKSSLLSDWNFAVETAQKETGAALVTIAHQDDRYHPDYAARLKELYRRYPDLSVFCTRYRTINAAGDAVYGKAEAVKRILRLPLRLRPLANRRFIKRLSLRFGNSICCPSCTYHLDVTGTPLFTADDQFVIDWDTLWRLAGARGRFVCAEEELMDYRVHDGAATKENIRNHNREREEAMMYAKMWPKPVVKLLMHFYRSAYTAYDSET